MIKHSLFLFAFLGSCLVFAQTSIKKTSVQVYSPWNKTFFSLASTNLGEQANGSAQIFFYNYLALGYQLGNGRKISVGVPFIFTTPGYNEYRPNVYQKGALKIHDIFVNYKVRELARLPGNIGSSWKTWVYLPTGKGSQNQGSIARFRNDLILTKPLDYHWSLEYFGKFNYYVQTKPIYVRESNNSKSGMEQTRLSNTRKFYLDHRMSVWYRFENQTGLGAVMSQKRTWYNSSLANQTSPRGNLGIGWQAKFSLSSSHFFTFEYINEVFQSDSQRLGQFRLTDTSLTLRSVLLF